ncbi:hypothetical protein ACFX2I_039673 [Malus domestica]
MDFKPMIKLIKPMTQPKPNTIENPATPTIFPLTSHFSLLPQNQNSHTNHMSAAQNAMEQVHDVEAKYYADREDAYDMRKELKGKKVHGHSHGHRHHHHHEGGCCSGEAAKPDKAEAKKVERGNAKAEAKAV